MVATLRPALPPDNHLFPLLQIAKETSAHASLSSDSQSRGGFALIRANIAIAQTLESLLATQQSTAASQEIENEIGIDVFVNIVLSIWVFAKRQIKQQTNQPTCPLLSLPTSLNMMFV